MTLAFAVALGLVSIVLAGASGVFVGQGKEDDGLPHFLVSLLAMIVALILAGR